MKISTFFVKIIFKNNWSKLLYKILSVVAAAMFNMPTYGNTNYYENSIECIIQDLSLAFRNQNFDNNVKEKILALLIKLEEKSFRLHQQPNSSTTQRPLNPLPRTIPLEPKRIEAEQGQAPAPAIVRPPPQQQWELTERTHRSTRSNSPLNSEVYSSDELKELSGAAKRLRQEIEENVPLESLAVSINDVIRHAKPCNK